MKAGTLVKSNRALPPRIVYSVWVVLVVFDGLVIVISIYFAQSCRHPFSHLAEDCGCLTTKVETEQLKLALQLVGCAIEDPFNLIFINN